MESLRDQALRMWESLADTLTRVAPKVLLGIAVVVLLLIAVKIVERILRSIFRRIKLDALFDRLGVSALLRKAGIVQPASELLPRIARYLLLFLFVQAAADALGLVAVSHAIGGFLAYLPNLFAALLLLVVGALAAQWAGGAVTRAARESGIDFAATLGNLLSALILFVVGIMAVSQLKIDTDIVRIVSVCLLSGLALAFGLSFGLGSRDITRNLLAGFYAKKVFRVGDPIELRGERGVLKAITAVQTLIEVEGRTVSVANSAFLDEVARG